jgi:preprotein translocase subunit SecY
MPELMTRLAVTLAALAIYRLGTHPPLAGIDQTALANLLTGIDQAELANLGSAFTVERVSSFALGVTPIISALQVGGASMTGPAPQRMHGA